MYIPVPPKEPNQIVESQGTNTKKTVHALESSQYAQCFVGDHDWSLISRVKPEYEKFCEQVYKLRFSDSHKIQKNPNI